MRRAFPCSPFPVPCSPIVICGQPQFLLGLSEFFGGRGGGAFNPIAVLHPRLEDASPLIAARAVGVLVVEDEVPPSAVDGRAVERTRERAEAFGGFQRPVGVEFCGQQFWRGCGVLQPSARHLAAQRRNGIAEVALKALERLVQPPDGLEPRPGPLCVPFGGEVGENRVWRLVVAVVRSEPRVVWVFLLQRREKSRHPRLHFRHRWTVHPAIEAEADEAVVVLRRTPDEKRVIALRRLPAEDHWQRRVV